MPSRSALYRLHAVGGSSLQCTALAMPVRAYPWQQHRVRERESEGSERGRESVCVCV